MSSKIMIIDDIDGSEGASTRRFSIDGHDYEIDLSDQNAEKLRDALTPFIDKARKSKSTSKSASKSGKNIGQVRAWLHENGYDVPQRGRISAGHMELYNAAH